MRRALLLYFANHDVPNPDPGDVACLTAIGVNEIDRRDMGFKSPSFLIMASLLVPAMLDPNHMLHGEITAAVAECKRQMGGTATMARAEMTAAKKPKGSLAETVKLTALPALGRRVRAHAQMMKMKAGAKPIGKRRPK